MFCFRQSFVMQWNVFTFSVKQFWFSFRIGNERPWVLKKSVKAHSFRQNSSKPWRKKKAKLLSLCKVWTSSLLIKFDRQFEAFVKKKGPTGSFRQNHAQFWPENSQTSKFSQGLTCSVKQFWGIQILSFLFFWNEKINQFLWKIDQFAFFWVKGGKTFDGNCVFSHCFPKNWRNPDLVISFFLKWNLSSCEKLTSLPFFLGEGWEGFWRKLCVFHIIFPRIGGIQILSFRFVEMKDHFLWKTDHFSVFLGEVWECFWRNFCVFTLSS